MSKETMHQDARHYVFQALGDYAADFDVDGITTALREHTNGSFDFTSVDHDLFWHVVKQHEHQPNKKSRD